MRCSGPMRSAKLVTTWVVYPFLWLLRPNAEPRLDWEHVESRWVAPEEVPAHKTVPGLRDVLASVYPLDIVDSALELQADRTHGARQLAAQAVARLAERIESFPDLPATQLLTRAKLAGQRLALARPTMVAIANAISAYIERLAQTDVATPTTLKRQARALARAVLREQEHAAEKLARHARPLLRGRILTLSYSSTVIAALKAARPDEVVVCESRPLFEGRTTARELASANIPVTLVSDAVGPSLVQDVDCVVVGADSILPNGDVVNKAGTYGLALAARANGKPFYVLAESVKVASPALVPLVSAEVHDPSELWDAPPAHVTPRNVYFDRTPARLVARYVTERGQIERARLGDLARDHQKRYVALFTV